LQLLHGPKRGARRLAFSPAGDSLAVGYYDGTIRCWDAAAGTTRWLASVGLTPTFLVWAPDGARMASALGSGVDAVFWCTAGGKVSTLADRVAAAGTGCLSADGRTLYVPTSDAIRRWSTRSGAELSAWPAWSPGHLAASADGAWIASTHPQSPLARDDGHHVAIRDARTGKVVSRIDDRAEFCDAVAFSPDCTRLAVAKHQSLWLWELPSCRAVCTHRSRKFFTGLAYSPDGRTLATSGNDGTVRFWDGASGEPVQAFDWQIGKALCVAFAPDGFRAAAGGETGKVVVWDVE
jgi:WD40 repeat protein